MKKIIKKSLENSYTYNEFEILVSNLLAENKATGHTQSEALTNYSLLNDRRMKRLDKTIQINATTIAEIKKINEPQTWLVLTEGWCGDAAQNLPVIHKIAAANKQINLQLVLRDDHEDLMNLFLTNGNQAIPKLILLDKQNNVLQTWGPRPSTATKMVADYIAKHGALDPEFKKDLQIWYNKNKGQNVQEDFVELIKNIKRKDA